MPVGAEPTDPGRRAARGRTGARPRAARTRLAALAAVLALAAAGAVVAVRSGGTDGVTPVVAAPGASTAPATGSTAPPAGTGTTTAGTGPTTAAGATVGGGVATSVRSGAAPSAGRASSARAGSGPTPRLRAGGAPFATRCAVSATLVPSCGAYWGIYSRRYGGGDVETSVTTWEQTIGRRFDIVLMYYDFSGRNGPGWFPDADLASLGGSRILLVDWESRDFAAGTDLRWADIAAGRYDAAVVVPAARRVRAYGAKIMLGFDHEMDLSHAKHGTAAEYVAAYRHLRDVFAAEGVDNVVWTWVPSGYVAYGNGPHVKSFYPGSTYVDWVGYDPYNYNTCHQNAWRTFDATVKEFYDWTARNGMADKPLLLQEYGLHVDGDARSRQWYRDIDDVLRKRPRIKALVRWDSDVSWCTVRIDSAAGMVEEFRAAGLTVDRP